jgi:imidazolonepropionase-like amidohydrolase
MDGTTMTDSRRRTISLSLVMAMAFMAPVVGAQAVVLRADRYLDVESGAIVRPAVFVVDGRFIRSVNPGGIPEGAEIVELGDTTLLPGMIDTHTHLALDLSPQFPAQLATDSAAQWAVRAVKNAEATLMAGFTTVRDLHSFHFVDVALAEASDRGWLASPRIVPAGHPLTTTGGPGDGWGFAPGVLEGGTEIGVADDIPSIRRAIRYQIKHGARVIKIYATSAILSSETAVGAQRYSEAELRAAVEEAAAHDARVAAHAHGTEGIKAAVRAGVASIEHGSILDDEAIDLMRSHGTFLVPTAMIWEQSNTSGQSELIRAKQELVRSKARESLERAIAAGVRIAFGTDAGLFPHGQNARELSILVERGMTPLQAIRSATVEAAELLGVADRGSLSAGLLADIIAVRGDPLADVSTLEDVVFVMKGGRRYKEPDEE